MLTAASCGATTKSQQGSGRSAVRVCALIALFWTCVQPLRFHPHTHTGTCMLLLPIHAGWQCSLLTGKHELHRSSGAFCTCKAAMPSHSRHGNLMVHVLSLLHSADLHSKQSLGITVASQLILSSDFQKQNSGLILLTSLLMPHAWHHSGSPFYRNLLFSLHCSLTSVLAWSLIVMKKIL